MRSFFWIAGIFVFVGLTSIFTVQASDYSELSFKCITAAQFSISIKKNAGDTLGSHVYSHEFDSIEISANATADTEMVTFVLSILDQNTDATTDKVHMWGMFVNGSNEFQAHSALDDTLTLVVTSDKDSTGASSTTILTDGALIRESAPGETIDPIEVHTITLNAKQGTLTGAPDGIYGLNFLLYFAIFGFFRIYSTFLIERYQLSLVVLSLVVSYVALPIVLINLFVSPLLSKLRKPKIITIISAIFMGCAMISITIFQPFYSIWFTLFLTAVGIGITMPFSASIISFMASRELQGSVMGNNQSLLAAAQGIASIFGGALAMYLNVLPLIIFGIISIISGALLFRHFNEYGHQENISDETPSL